jgi:hypothetical protein
MQFGITNPSSMPAKNQKAIKASDLTHDQLASARDFLTGNDWPESENKRTVPREEVARLIAWYGALRFRAGADGIGTLEKPPRLLQSNGQPVTETPAPEAAIISDFELIDVTIRALK